MPNINLPSYKEIVERNDLSKYKGYELIIPVVHNLVIVIDCQNENNIFPNGEPIICFKWCTKNGFPIAMIRYVNCEEGYYLGIKFLLDTATDFKNSFDDFIQNSTINED